MKGTPFDFKRVVQFSGLNTLFFAKTLPHRSKRLSPDVRLRNFREVNQGLDREAAIQEAKRCFYCGRCVGCDLCFLLCPDLSIGKKADGGYRVNTDYCKGCGICVDVCPRQVIEIEEQDERASHG
jgi:2-oxoacid:acceptor oxidoreductase delta subunit (pyruvate/2-ketoisovalerate family)